MAESVTNVARIAVGAFNDYLDKRREKVITRIKKSNTQHSHISLADLGREVLKSKCPAAIRRFMRNKCYTFLES